MTKIEWVRNPDGSPGYTINPVKGLCPMACPYCYARRMYKRFKWNPEIRFDADVLWDFEPKKPSRAFIGSTIELFGDWIPNEYLKAIFQWVTFAENQKHTFIFLTKKPENLPREFPDNCWVGVTATNTSMAWIASKHLSQIEASVKFLSIEPLLSWETNTPYTTENIVAGLNGSLDWLIIGQQTPVRKSTMPKVEWIREIVEAADRAGVPVFLKDNLRGLLPKEPPFYTKCCAEVNGKDPCYEEPCLSEHVVDECSQAPNFWMLRQEMPAGVIAQKSYSEQ